MGQKSLSANAGGGSASIARTAMESANSGGLRPSFKQLSPQNAHRRKRRLIIYQFTCLIPLQPNVATRRCYSLCGPP
jgi:hypothetical protein